MLIEFTFPSVFCSIFFRGSHPRDVFVAPGGAGETPQRDAEESGVLRRAAQSLGENVPETEIHQQARQEETGV